MTSRLIKTFLLILVLALGWAGQAFALACDDLAMGSHADMANDGDHAMAGSQMDHGCPDCQQGKDCHHGAFHCLKASSKTDVFMAAKKGKTQDVVVAISEIRQFRTRHHQIRAPGSRFTAPALPPVTLAALHIRLQV